MTIILTTDITAAIESTVTAIPNPFKDPYEGMSPLEKELVQVSQPYEKIMEGQSYRDDIAYTKTIIDKASCNDLLTMYTQNTGWSLRAYVAYKILENCEDKI